jgi:tRNA pseudouridine13 synthase
MEKQTKQFFFTHSKIDIYFKQSKDDFVVNEIPLYPFSENGEHIVLNIRKKDLSTWDMVNILSNHLGCRSKDIGYAGLKDKNALTTQYISLPKSYEIKLDTFSHKNIKILNKTYHNNKIKIGHLKGNKFFIRLKRVLPYHATILQSVLKNIAIFGMPNYFGTQRFGINSDNYLQGKAIIDGKLKEKNRKLKQMYLNSYQSFLFNNWLSSRVNLSKLIMSFKPKEIYEKLNMSIDEVKQFQEQPHPFKILLGDVMSHYPFGKIFYAELLQEEAIKFNDRDRVPTGLLCGKKTKIAIDKAKVYEDDFNKITNLNGSRRFAWIFPDNIQSNYKEDSNHFELSFSLPKGSYATELISELIH